MRSIIRCILVSFFAFSAVSYAQTFPRTQWETLPDLPYKQMNHVTVGWKNLDTNYVITIGGRVNNTVSKKVLLYNTVSQEYRELAPMPVAVEKAGGFVLGDSIYIVGGANGLLGLLTKTVYKFDIKANTWERKNDFPLAIGEITSSTVSYDNKHAYVVAGLTGIIALNSVYMYNANADTWNAASLLPTLGLFSTSVSMLNDSTLFVAGGIRLGNLLSNTFIGRINKNNLLSILWSTGPSFPGGSVYGLSSWGDRRGRSFFTGGSRLLNDNDMLASTGITYMYDEHTGNYDTLLDKPTPITHTQIYGYDAVPVNGVSQTYIYVPGGNTGAGATDAHEVLVMEDTVESAVNVQVINSNVPNNFNLYQNYPNPFNPSTTIKFQLPEKTFVVLKVYNFLGKEISSLISSTLNAGTYEYKFDASQLAGGVYFYSITAGSFKETGKMVLLK